jgi:hypothetical protein
MGAKHVVLPSFNPTQVRAPTRRPSMWSSPPLTLPRLEPPHGGQASRPPLLQPYPGKSLHRGAKHVILPSSNPIQVSATTWGPSMSSSPLSTLSRLEPSHGVRAWLRPPFLQHQPLPQVTSNYHWHCNNDKKLRKSFHR